MVAQLTAVGVNAPKHFPKSPDDLFKKKQVQQAMSPHQWAATFSQLLGKPVKVNKPVPAP